MLIVLKDWISNIMAVIFFITLIEMFPVWLLVDLLAFANDL